MNFGGDGGSIVVTHSFPPLFGIFLTAHCSLVGVGGGGGGGGGGGKTKIFKITNKTSQFNTEHNQTLRARVTTFRRVGSYQIYELSQEKQQQLIKVRGVAVVAGSFWIEKKGRKKKKKSSKVFVAGRSPCSTQQHKNHYYYPTYEGYSTVHGIYISRRRYYYKPYHIIISLLSYYYLLLITVQLSFRLATYEIHCYYATTVSYCMILYSTAG